MKKPTPRLLSALCLCAWLVCPPLQAGSAPDFAELAGWWSAQPTHGGDTSPLALEIAERDGKRMARLSIPAIDAYDIDLGELAIDGDSIRTLGLAFPLTWNPATGTLSGRIPADAAPVYDIPVEFHRAAPLVKPAPTRWQAPRPQVVWSVDTGGSPVWAGLAHDERTGTVFVANEAGKVRALDRDGRTRWTFETGKPVRAQPALLGGELYVHSDSGFLHRLEAASGRQVWQARVDAGSAPRLPTDAQGTRWDRYGSGVVGDRTRLYVASRDRHLYALDRKTGREVWRVAAGDIMTATPAVHGDLVISAAFDGQVRAVSARDGAPRWSYDAKLAVPGDLTVAGGRVLLGSRSYDLIALDAATGREAWKHYYWFSWIESPAVVRDGVVYTGSSDATHVYAIDLADGSRRWKSPVPGYSWQRTAVDDRWVIAGTVGEGAYPGRRAGSLVALDRATGDMRWMLLEPPTEERARRAWGFGATPIIAGDRVYAADLDGRLHAIALN